MRTALMIFSLLISAISLRAQTYFQDPAVNDASVNPNPVSTVGSIFDMTFELGNNGFDAISGADAADQMSFTISLDKCDPSKGSVISSIGVDALSGPALAYFDITYDPVHNVFTGQQKTGVSIEAFAVFDLVIHAQVTQLSSFAGDNSIGSHLLITPDAASFGFNDAVNDNGEALTHTNLLITLPDMLTSFNASVSDCEHTRISWATETETPGSSFAIEYSADAVAYKSIETIPVKEKASGSTYSATVEGPVLQGYYRLKMISIDGTATYGPVKAVNGKCETNQLSATPNPLTNNKTTIRGLTETSSIRVFDLKGCMLQNLVTTQSTQDIDFTDYAKGIYVICIIEGRHSLQSFEIIRL